MIEIDGFMYEGLGKCSVVDKEGNHCPEEPKFFLLVDGEPVVLCPQCRWNVWSGAYDVEPYPTDEFVRLINRVYGGSHGN